MSHSRQRARSYTTLLLLGLLIGTVGCGDDSSSPNQPLLPDDTAPPAAPANLGITLQDVSKTTFSWTPNSEPDLAGYRVYRYDPAPERIGAYVCLNDSLPWPHPELTVSGVAGTTAYFRVSAIDASQNESGLSDAILLTFQGSGSRYLDRAPDGSRSGSGSRGGTLTDGNGHVYYGSGDFEHP